MPDFLQAHIHSLKPFILPNNVRGLFSPKIEWAQVTSHDSVGGILAIQGSLVHVYSRHHVPSPLLLEGACQVPERAPIVKKSPLMAGFFPVGTTSGPIG